MRHYFNVRGGAGDLTKPDVNTRIQDNLYLAVNSEWLSKAEIPADRTSTGINLILDMKIEDRMMKDFADFASGKKQVPDVKNLQKAINLYKLAIDFDKRNNDGAKPIQKDLKKLASLNNFADLNKQAASLVKEGFDFPIDVFVSEDMKDTSHYSLYLNGPGTFLPDTTAYQTPDAEKLLKTLSAQSVNLFEMAGVDHGQAQKWTDDAVAFDKKLAKVVKSAEEWADFAGMYNPTSLKNFEAKFDQFDIEGFLDQLFEKLPENVVMAETRYFDKINEVLNSDNFDEIKGWMLVKFINSAAIYLSQDFRRAAFPFRQAVYGVAEMPSQEKHAYRLANTAFDEVDGIYYGQTYFGADAKADVISMIKNMLKVYEERIQNNTWLSEDTKKQAIVKLKALKLKVGYPDQQQAIFDRLQVDSSKSLYENEAKIAQEKVKYNFEKLGKPVDSSIWAMPGNLNNACYDPQNNDLTFPAGILQAPFYDAKQSRGANYGGIGATIGHEVSHAFDNNGAQFDEKGNLKNWWTKADYAEFNKRTNAVAAIFDGLQYGPAKLNGKQVVSENIADLSGLSCAIAANKLDGGDMQDLFKTYAKSWMQKQRPEAITAEVQSDVHAPQPTRVNIPSQCQDAFYEAFDVKETDGMWLDPKDRITIW
ncbi:M13 family metallopeptidase [uncultured Lactobacillus sp.]|uniref:M13 family metallopeptidase n=1 Tax=uncultured Lactobacillus sp. TaxID=153152 RepID=UPI002607FE57|nr:M13 family metallopeptidase [uncultured Lactobacillus sp.]